MNPGDQIQMKTMTAEQFWQNLLQSMWDHNADSAEAVVMIAGMKIDVKIEVLAIHQTGQAS